MPMPDDFDDDDIDELVEEFMGDPVRAATDRLVGSFFDAPQVQDLFSRAARAVDSIGKAMDRAQTPRQKPQTPPKRRQNVRVRRPSKEQIARKILHFADKEALTKDLIKKRQRDLASLCHPDKGGSTEAMQKINQAADILLAAYK